MEALRRRRRRSADQVEVKTLGFLFQKIGQGTAAVLLAGALAAHDLADLNRRA